jgi:hypothetical protein
VAHTIDEVMTIRKRLGQLNPFRVLNALETLNRLHEFSRKVADGQKELTRQMRAVTRQIEELDEVVKGQAADLARLPALHSTLDACHERIEQCAVAYEKDAALDDSLPALRRKLDPERCVSHATSAVNRATLETNPTPHIVISDLLPDDVCDEVVSAIPPGLFFKRQNETRRELPVPFFFAPKYHRVVWGFLYQHVIARAVLPAVIEKFRPALDAFIARHWPALGRLAESGITIGVSNSRLMQHRPGYRIRPHRDPRWAFLTCLVYLQRREDTHAYGTQFYRLREEQEPSHHSPLWVEEENCRLVKDVPARRNGAVVFLNSTGAHGASVPADAPEGFERYIYQVQFGPDQATRQMLIEGLEGDARLAWATARSKY